MSGHTFRSASTPGYACLSFLIPAVAVGAALYCLVPPRVVPNTAPSTEFSAERAMKHLEVIAREPHPTGSAANAQTRNYLVGQLNSLGLKPEVEKAFAITSWDIGGAPYGAGVPENIIARSSGANSTGALLLMAIMTLSRLGQALSMTAPES